MKRIKHTCALTACLTALCVQTAAIAQDQKPSAPAIIPANSKLDIDPTETISIIGWWTNGEEIMLIKQDGAFNWWGQPNRFRPPSKIGRWDRQNYRTIWLEPYVDRKNPGVMPPRIRAPMRRTDGKIFIDAGSALNMLHVDVAPVAPEDLYVGKWSGPGGSLILAADGRYQLESSPPSANPPSRNDPALLSRASHNGTWSFDGQYIRLLSDGSAQNPVICAVVDRPDRSGAKNSESDGGSDAGSKKSSDPMNEALTTPLGELRRITPITPITPAASNSPPVNTPVKDLAKDPAKSPAKDPLRAPPVVPVP